MKNAIVIGATGDVGLGIVEALLGAEFNVLAIARNAAKLDQLSAQFGSAGNLTTLASNVGTEDDAERTAREALKVMTPDLVVLSVNGTAAATALEGLSPDHLSDVMKDNLLPHLAATKAFVPLLPRGALFVGIGGGMADFIFPGMAAISMAQSAQRTLYRYLAAEPAYQHVVIRELMLVSMIAGASKAGIAEPHWITASDVGRHVIAICADHQAFPGPILMLKSRKQVGLPERAPAN